MHDEAQCHDRDDPPSPGRALNRLHPFAPRSRPGYATCRQLEEWLAEITGFAEVSLQPMPVAGEFAGLLVIRATTARGGHRHTCLIPQSAWHQSASAVMEGLTWWW